MKASSKARLAAEASRITADVDGHGQIELGQPSSRVTLDRSSAVHRQTTQLVDPEHRYTVPRVQVDADVASVCIQQAVSDNSARPAISAPVIMSFTSPVAGGSSLLALTLTRIVPITNVIVSHGF